MCPNTTHANMIPALGRFNVHDGIPGTGDAGIGVIILKTNLAGEPIRFSFNENLGGVPNGSLVMLNADITELGEIRSGILGGNIIEEDESLWGVAYDQSPVEPNQIVFVWEIRGEYSTITVPRQDGEEMTFYYIDTGQDGTVCQTIWRVVDFQSYVDDNNVPYCDVGLEGIQQMALDVKFDGQKYGSKTGEKLLVSRKWKDLWNSGFSDLQLKDLYTGEPLDEIEEVPGVFPKPPALIEEEQEQETQMWATFVDIIDDDGWGPYFFEKLNAEISPWGLSTSIDMNFTFYPAWMHISYSTSLWDTFNELMGFNGKVLHIRRNLYIISVDETSLGDTVTLDADGNIIEETSPDITDLGDFGPGLKLVYTKRDVVNKARAAGITGEKDEEGEWIPFTQQDIKLEEEIELLAATNILNGYDVRESYQAPEWALLTSRGALKSYAVREMMKTVVRARSAQVSSASIPWSVEVGDVVTGSSAIGGTVSFLVTSLSRNTDAQRNTSETMISGNTKAITGPESSWVPRIFETNPSDSAENFNPSKYKY